ncbi:MAG TPA: 2,3-diaminopropionate biosynthesis protein SbnB [Thermoanaerobaculia bacterium]|jgi:2,3-diaminopropionate biosynthesis protein SbnB|nr:2,3-diaminopropionate biosynthesis protein SbnB [Thermoanaerobaculia bacterium]
MEDGGLLVLSGNEVSSLLAGRESELIDLVGRAYVAHRSGARSLPHSTFLRFPHDERNRIIALPAYLGDGFGVAGMKWIASFPANVERSMERASAVLILNSCETGRPEAILESSVISARRTAASAALAARALLEGAVPERVGLIGTGVINLEVARFLRAAMPGTSRFLLYDLDPGRARRFAETLRETLGSGIETELAGRDEVLATCPLISFATTAIRPHVEDLSGCRPGAVILHLSLRDLAPEVILTCDNVVDDPDHVCRAQTSLHLAEQATGGRGFIRCTLADILQGTEPPRRDGRIAVFSPFGLGVLDIAVGQRIADLARTTGLGTHIRSFLPAAPAGSGDSR